MINTWHDAEVFLNSFIPTEKKYRFPGEVGLARTKYLLEQAGNPQEKIKVIHIAGTSGKGSTASLISHVLTGQGFNVGLSMSPHLIDLRERFQINNAFVAFNDVVEMVNILQEPIKETAESIHGKLTYFEIMTSLTYLLFQKKRVDYAVIETGLGGTYDATNVVSNASKIAVITKIGLDHMEILGNTLTEIAAQKAGIIQRSNKVFLIEQRESVKKIIAKKVYDQNASLEIIKKSNNFKTSLLGDFQRENSSLALAVVRYVSKRDNWLLDKSKLGASLNTIQIPGRMQKITYKNKEIILDGAHNPQKMSALISSLNKIYPEQKLDFLVALKKGKDYRNTLKYILPKADSITFTAFMLNKQGFPIQAENPERLHELAQKMGYDSSVIKDPAVALTHALMETKHPLIITGSFYLLSEIYTFIN